MSDTLDKQIDGTHYKDMGIQPWEIIEKNKLDYFEGAALKYLLRWRKKDGVIDLDKIIHYIEHIKELALAGHYGEEFVAIENKPVDIAQQFTCLNEWHYLKWDMYCVKHNHTQYPRSCPECNGFWYAPNKKEVVR